MKPISIVFGGEWKSELEKHTTTTINEWKELTKSSNAFDFDISTLTFCLNIFVVFSLSFFPVGLHSLCIVFNLFPLLDFIYELFSLFGSSSGCGFLYVCVCVWLCITFFLFAVQFYFHWFPILFFRVCIYRLSAFALNARHNARLLNSKRLVLFTQQISQNILERVCAI